MIDPHELITMEAGVVLDLLATIKRLHMGTDQGYRHPPCGVCHLVTEVEDSFDIPRPPVPVPTRRPQLRSLPPEAG